MYELIQLAENSFYMDCPAKVGFFRISPEEVVIIDSGSDKDAGKKVKKILDAQGWKLQAIFNTHSHADHIGGNQYLQTQTGCRIYAPGLECSFTNDPILEPTALYGGYACGDLHNKFLMAKESKAEPLTEDVLPQGLEIIRLPGHSYDMVGFRTSDDVVFLADCLSSAETLEKYKISYLYDVKSYLETLAMVKALKAKAFVPAHAPQTEDIAPLAQLNIEKTEEVISGILNMLTVSKSFEDLLTEVFDTYGMTMNLTQNVLIGSTLRSYLSCLKDAGQADFFFENNRMLWSRKRSEIPEVTL